MVNFFLHRPIFASSIAMIMVVAGLICLRLLPVAQFPEIAPPQVVVTAIYPGASAQVVADTVTTPLEQQINGTPGMIYMSSFSGNDGRATITVSFEVGYSLDLAAVNVQNRVSQATGKLPAIVNQTGITVQRQSPNFPLAVSLYSPDDSVDIVTISNYAYLQILDPLKRLPGVADVTTLGERRYSMRVWLHPDKLAQRQLTAMDVRNAIAEQNLQVAAGKLGQEPVSEGSAFEFQVSALGRLHEPEQFGDIIVRNDTASDALVRLRDVARIELGAQDYSSSAYFNDKPMMFLGISQTPDSNALRLDQAVREKMAELSKRFPKGIAYNIAYDTTIFVSSSINEVVFTLAGTILLVFAVVYVFLPSWRTVAIPGVTIPVSLIGTLAVMLVAGFSLNTVSLLGMVLAVGLVVDDAIVVVENVERQIARGLTPLAAAKAAMAEVTGPVVATTAVLMAVFVPVALLPGVTGRLYHQFALTVAISVGISAFNSLTLSPALCVILLRNREPPRLRLLRAFNAGFDGLAYRYAGAVRHLIRARHLMLVLFVGGLALTYALYSRLSTTFLPNEDQGYFIVVVHLPDGASVQRTEAVTRRVWEVLQGTPGVQHILTVSGLNVLTGSNQSNMAAAFAVLKPWGERGSQQDSATLVASVRSKLLSTPEAIVLSFDPPLVPGIGVTGGFEFQLEDLGGHGSFALEQAVQALIAEARKQPEIDGHHLFTMFSASSPQYVYNLDRSKAKLLGVSLPDVFSTLQIYLGSLYVDDFNLFGRTFRVTMQAERDARMSPSDLPRLHVRSTQGGMVPLNALGALTANVGPETVSHYNIFGSAPINGAAAPGYTSSQAMAAMERAAAQALPADFGYEWTGISYEEVKAGSLGHLIFIVSLVFVFLFLAALYESWSMPFTVMLAVPLALLGALAALWLRGKDVDIYSQVGFVMLIGLAAKNGILMVEFARRLREEGCGIVEAAMQAGRLRLRPIVMTAFTFILGVIPLMVASGAGAVGRQSIGTTVFGGMLAATAFSLLYVPVFYALIEGVRASRSQKRAGAEPDAETEGACVQARPAELAQEA